MRNVARCWVNETALLLDKQIDDAIPRTCKCVIGVVVVVLVLLLFLCF